MKVIEIIQPDDMAVGPNPSQQPATAPQVPQPTPPVQQPQRQHLLILVHPGSCCGSADYNIPYSAESGRSYIAQELNQWTGPLLVIDGGLSDELQWPKYRELASAITNALARNKAAGAIAERVMGSDDSNFDQTKAAARFVRKYKLKTNEWFIELTGAWAGEGEGCVTSVWEVLHRMGYTCDIRNSALTLDDDEFERPRDNDPDEDYEEETR